MRLYYWTILIVIVLFSTVAVGGVMFLLESLGVIRRLSVYSMLALLVVAIVATSFMAYFVGRRILAPMVKLSKASKEVTRGNYDVTIEDSSKLEEVQTTFRNFNAMVRQLGSVSTLSNDFVANISHEFKTPLTAIEGYAMLLQDSSLPPEEQQEYADRILQSTRRLTTLVGNVLTLSKIENQHLIPQAAVYRLDEQIRQAVVLLEPEWSRKDLVFNASLEEISINASEGLLLHVWTNLIGNAVKFSPPGAEIELHLVKRQDSAAFSIRDHGCGMDEEVKSHIFEKFYQGDATRQSDGNGLGLAMVKKIIDLSGGTVEVESQPGEGTLFRVFLPRKS